MPRVCCCCCCPCRIRQQHHHSSSTASPWVRSPQGRQHLAAARRQVRSLVKAGQLNASQGQAVEAALTQTVTLWQGPPGTGQQSTSAMAKWSVILLCCQRPSGQAAIHSVGHIEVGSTGPDDQAVHMQAPQHSWRYMLVMFRGWYGVVLLDDLAPITGNCMLLDQPYTHGTDQVTPCTACGSCPCCQVRRRRC